jgi:hypothetical protein
LDVGGGCPITTCSKSLDACDANAKTISSHFSHQQQLQVQCQPSVLNHGIIIERVACTYNIRYHIRILILYIIWHFATLSSRSKMNMRSRGRTRLQSELCTYMTLGDLRTGILSTSARSGDTDPSWTGCHVYTVPTTLIHAIPVYSPSPTCSSYSSCRPHRSTVPWIVVSFLVFESLLSGVFNALICTLQIPHLRLMRSQS